MESRYGVLRAVAALYQILAGLALFGVLLGTSYPGWLPIVIGLGAAISWFVAGQAIAVLLAIEEQTRKSTMLLEQLTRSTTTNGAANPEA